MLELDNSQMLEVTNDVETAVKCVVAAARPAVGIRWYLGDKDVTVMAETEETPTDNDVRNCTLIKITICLYVIFFNIIGYVQLTPKSF